MTTITSARVPEDEARLLAAAAGGDAEAFGRLAGRYRRELHAHCYRMLGSLQDAEDALQETLLAAWQGLGGFEGRSSLRLWLHRIATNACLRLAERRPQRILSFERGPARTDVHDLGEYREQDPTFLEPYPHDDDPAASYERRENVELAFVAALQKLPATQRAVLILREVLEFTAADVAAALDTTVVAVNSALQRARRTVDQRIVEGTQARELQALGAPGREQLVTAFVQAWERSDVPALLDLLAEDARFAMPPFAAWFRGRADIGRFLSERTFARPWRALPLMASGQLAVACYRHDADSGRFGRSGDQRCRAQRILTVLTLRDGRIAELHAFLDPATQRWFGLPEEMPDRFFRRER